MAAISSKRSRSFMIFFMAAVSLICAFIIFKATFETTILPRANFLRSSSFHSEKLSECRSICTTEDCLYIANLISNNMDQSANPCEDFYSFACGGLHEKLGKDTNYSMFRKQEEYLFTVIKDVIEKSKGPEGSTTEKLKAVYESCINYESADVKSVQTLLEFLKEIGIPNWPNLNSVFTFQDPSLEEVLGTLGSYNEFVFFRFFSPPRRFMSPGISNLTGVPQYTYRDKLLKPEETENVVFEILKQLDIEILNATQVVEDFVEIDTSIQALYKESKANRKKCENISEVNVAVDCIHEKEEYKTFTCNVMKSYIRHTKVDGVNFDGYTVDCSSLYYFENIASLMNCYTHRALANYISLRVIMNNFEYLTLSLRRKLRLFFQNEKFAFETERYFGMDNYKFCTYFVKRYMAYNLALVYVPDIFPGKAVDDVHGIFTEVTNITANFISQQDWIEENKKQDVSAEVISIVDEFYQGTNLLNETKLNAIYEKFQFNPSKDNFFRNVLECKRLLTSLQFSESEDLYLLNLPFAADASYSGTLSIGFGLLLPPFYKYGMDKLFNSAVTAQVLGHEVGHMINYYLGKKDVYNETRENFERRMSCLRKQYSTFYIDTIGKYVNGNKTVGENFPDHLALKVTETIAENYFANRGDKFYLPGLPFSTEQLFYVAHSQLWCSVKTKEAEEFTYEEDFHSPPKFRVLGAFQNSERFSQIFNCKPNSAMNPEDKCSVIDS